MSPTSLPMAWLRCAAGLAFAIATALGPSPARTEILPAAAATMEVVALAGEGTSPRF